LIKKEIEKLEGKGEGWRKGKRRREEDPSDQI